MRILEVQGLSKFFGGLAAVNNVDMHIEQGEILALIGPNGAGKTTLFHCITNTLPPTKGKVLWKGEDIAGKGPYVAAGRGIIRSFQNANVFPKLTVLDNVLIGAQRRFKSNFLGIVTGLPSTRREEQRYRAEAADRLRFCRLEDTKDRSANSLSYGEMRRLQIAIALAGEPELLLLDEPAGGLNPQETHQLMDMIREIQAGGISVCLVEHDMKFVMGLCSRVIVLDAGSKIAEGTPREIQSNERVIRVYLGGSYSA